MRRLAYADSSVVTVDRLADKVVEYASALARYATSDTVWVPIVGPHGTPSEAQFLLGPASQLVSLPEEDGPFVDLPVEATLAELDAKLRLLHAREVHPIAEPAAADGQVYVDQGEEDGW